MGLLKRVAFVIFSLSLFVGCEQPADYERDYPLFVSMKVSNITLEGVSVEAVATGTISNAEDHGFVWTKTEVAPTINNASRLSLGKPSSFEFKADIQTRLLKNTKYNIRPYIRTATKVSYGPTQTFLALGAVGPILESFAPKVVVPKDLVTIKGARFGDIERDIKVSFKSKNLSYSAVVKSVKDDMIVVEAPEFWDENATISVLLAGNEEKSFTEQIARKLPTILATKVTGVCEKVEVIGEDFLTFGVPEFINNRLVSGDVTVTNTLITLPAAEHNRNGVTVTLSYDRPGTLPSLVISKKVADNFPRATISMESVPLVVGIGDLLTFNATNIPACGNVSVFSFQEVKFQVEQVTTTQIKIKITEIPCRNFFLEFRFAGSQSVQPQASFSGKEIKVTSTTAEGAIGDNIVIRGESLADHFMYVTSVVPPPGQQQLMFLPLVSSSDTEYVYKIPVPDLLNFNLPADGRIRIVLRKCDLEIETYTRIKIIEPTVTGFSPQNYSSPMTITVTGTNFRNDNSTSVIVRDNQDRSYSCFTTVNSSTQITAVVNLNPANGYVDGLYTVSVQMYNKQYSAPTKLNVDFP